MAKLGNDTVQNLGAIHTLVYHLNVDDPSLTKIAFSFLRDVWGLNTGELDNIDPNTLAERIQRVRSGLSVEHEFAAIASWLGKSTLVLELDNVLHKTGANAVPDFLVFANEKDRQIPLLIEVKSRNEPKLKMKRDCFDSMRCFAESLGMPLLVGWKRHGLWTLVDSGLFELKQSNYHLTFDCAMKNNLMSQLFGNVWITLRAEFRLALKLRILDPIDKSAKLLPEGGYSMRIEDAAFWTRHGRLSGEAGKEFFWLFVAGTSDSRISRDEDLLTHEFLVDDDRTFNLSDVLLSRLSWTNPELKTLDWLGAIRKGLAAILRISMEC